MKKLLQNFLRNESGATAVEYGLIVAGVAAVIIPTVITLGGQVNAAFLKITQQMP